MIVIWSLAQEQQKCRKMEKKRVISALVNWYLFSPRVLRIHYVFACLFRTGNGVWNSGDVSPVPSTTKTEQWSSGGSHRVPCRPTKFDWPGPICPAIPENREFKKMEIQFFPSKTCIVDTYRVTNFLPKLVDMLLFSTEKKNWISILVFPYFRVMPIWPVQGSGEIPTKQMVQSGYSASKCVCVTDICTSPPKAVIHGEFTVPGFDMFGHFDH